jgi:hypothetical protein
MENTGMPQREHQGSESYPARMRALGLRPVQIWVPDTARPGFAEELRRQVDLLRGTPEEEDSMSFIESVQDTRGWA